MSINYKYQDALTIDLTTQWVAGNREQVRERIRTLKNKAQAAYIAASVMWQLMHYKDGSKDATDFLHFIHPNER